MTLNRDEPKEYVSLGMIDGYYMSATEWRVGATDEFVFIRVGNDSASSVLPIPNAVVEEMWKQMQ